jgi:hypothetical protein
LAALSGAACLTLLRVGLPMMALAAPDGALIGALDDMAIDPTRPDLFSGEAQRAIPLQMLYPASAAGTPALYLPHAEPQVDAIVKTHGWMSRVLLGQFGTLVAPWTNAAKPLAGGPYPVILYLPGVTGYMQMGSFQTTALAAQGSVVVTLNQPGAVAAAALPNGEVVVGLTRTEAAAVIAPSYRATGLALPARFARALAPDSSIIPYFSADVGPVLDRLAQINADPAHLLHGMLDLDHVGVMGMSLGAIVAAQACASEARIDACLMMDAPVPTAVATVGLRQPALWISRPKSDQRLERAASGGWPEEEIDAQAATINEALANSPRGELMQIRGLFHLDFTDLPALQPALGWLGQSGADGGPKAHRQINQLTRDFFAGAFSTLSR